MSNRTKTILLLVVGLVLGLTLPFSNPANFLFLFYSSIIVGLCSALTIIFGLFYRPLLKWGFVGLLTLGLSLTVCLGLEKLIRNHKQDTARHIIADIDKYKNDNGNYPLTLEQFKIKDKIKGLTYEPYDSLQEFRIEYLMDGFNRQYYDSKTKEWGTLGWND